MSEYWIQEDGSVEFADGDIGDQNHEAVVIRRVMGQIMDAVENVCSPLNRWDRQFDSDSDWDEWKAAVAKAYAEEMIDAQPAKAATIKELLQEDPDRIMFKALKRAGVTKTDWSVAEGNGDGRRYAMERWGWKTYRNGNVETWRMTREDVKAIIDGLDEISNDEGWSERKFNRYQFTINVFSTRRYFYLTVPQMRRWLTNPSAKIVQDDPEQEISTAAAVQGNRQLNVDSVPDFYRNRPGVVNPIGDSVVWQPGPGDGSIVRESDTNAFIEWVRRNHPERG